MTSPIRRITLLTALCIIGSTPLYANDEPFPRPPELEPDIAFWVSIFTEYSSDEGVLHDNRYLGVVYEKIPMPSNSSRRVRNRKVGARRDHYKAILRTLASGKREKLSAEEQRVLSLWPEDVTNETLAAAVGRIRYQQGLTDRFRGGL